MTDFKNNLKLSLPQMKLVVTFFLCLIGCKLIAQKDPGIIIGSVMDEKSRALEGATVQLNAFHDSLVGRMVLTDNNGAFRLIDIPFGYYKLRISYVGLVPLTLDSIHFRADRYDFNLNDIILKQGADSGKLEEIIIYAEKALIQNKDGNIIFNAGESALTAGSNASELLTNVPLVTKDPSGKLLVRGKEPKILIDDKPVELNLQQLQDLLESMPGSSVEKIEVMTNPPPQYANEQGGVINIVTKKGTIGKSGRISVYAGSRGEGGMNGSFNYRKQGFSVNINSGAGYNNFEGSGYSRRQNLYKDSTNSFHTENNYHNRNLRPNFRSNINYDLDKFHSFNLVVQYNQNEFENRNTTEYMNLNRFDEIYRLSERTIRSTGENYNPNIGFSYTIKTKKPGESIRIINDLNFSSQANTREFFQQFFNPDHSPNGIDSTQQQINATKTRGHNIRLNYDLPFSKSRTYLSFGSFFNRTRSDVDVNATYRKKSDSSWAALDALTNDFRFRQKVLNVRGSVKQVFKDNFSATVGVNAEMTNIHFDLFKSGSEAGNDYWSFLPFATLNRNWKEVLNLTFSYRRTIRRPGIGELNPTIDFSDPYNIRFGNPDLAASVADNFDLVLGKTHKSFYANLGLGYNIVEDIFSPVRTLMGGGVTEITWQNISGRKEYEMSTWSGYTVSKNMKVNLSASYSYNSYSDFDKAVRKFRDGGSITSNLNMNYILKELYTATGSFTFNRFANPQGRVKSSLSMNIGLQAKMLQKKMTVTLNIIDPFMQQQNRTFTYGTNFNLESYSTTQTRNFRMTVGYNFSAKKKKPTAKKTTAPKKPQPPKVRS